MRWRLLLLLALQLLLFLFFLLGHVVADGAAGGGAYDGMVAGDVPGYAANDGALDATLRHRAL